MDELQVIAEGNGAYLIEAHGSTFSVAPIMPGQRRNYAVWQCPIDDADPMFTLQQRGGEWYSHSTHDAEILVVVRHELARRGYLGAEAMQATGADRPVYRW